MAEKFTSVEEYIGSFPEQTQAVLESIRRTVHDAVPGGQDAISYNIATLKLEGRSVVHYAGWAEHVSLYPVPGGDEALQRDLAPYVAGKGTLKFPLSEPVPQDLVARVVHRLVDERHTPA